MSNSEIETLPESVPAWAGTARLGFFWRMTIAFLLIIAVGFSPTFYMGKHFGAPPLPPSLFMHGVILTVWFLLFTLQVTLVALRKLTSHRRLGMASLVVAVAVVVSGLGATLGQVSRLEASGIDIEAELDQVSPLVWSGTLVGGIGLITFSATMIVGVGSSDFGRALVLSLR